MGKREGETGMQPVSSEGVQPPPRQAVNKLRMERSMPREELASYLAALARGMRDGAVTLRDGGSELAVQVGPEPIVKVKASRKKDATTVEISLTWGDDG